MTRNENEKVSIWLTREGWVYLTVLSFVTVGAVLRSVNLLIFMAGMMTMPLLLNWRVQRHLFGKLICRRTIPQRIHAGQLINFQWEFENLSERMTAWNLVIKDQIDRSTSPAPHLDEDESESAVQVTRFSRPKNREEYDTWRSQQKSKKKPKAAPKSNIETVNLTFLQVDPEQTEFHSYRCLFSSRGLYQIGPAIASSAFPFGLLRARLNLAGAKNIIVAPKLGKLSANWDRRQKSVALGSEATNRQLGTNEDEFYAVRQWRSGDNQRHIHWRSTAKRQTPMVRQFDQLSNRDMALVLDLFVPPPEETLVVESRDRFADRCESVLSFAATVVNEAGAVVQGRVGIGVCGSEASVIIDRNHHEFLVRVMRELAIAQPGSSRDLENVIGHLARNVSTGTPIYVISSREQPEQVASQLAQNQRIAKSVHWLTVDSNEFKSLFSPDRPAEQLQLEALQSKWVNHDSR